MTAPPSSWSRLAAVTAAAALVVLPACGDDDSSTDTTTSSTTTTVEAPTEVRAYFLRDEVVGPVARTAEGAAVAEAAMHGLLQGPSSDEEELGFSTTIPDGTDLLSVAVEDGLATVDLSEEFTSGGGSASMMGRVAQVVFTLTQFDTVDGVTFEIEGEPLTELGGEGLLLEEPQTRDDWESLSPSILVESPLPFAEVTSPLRLTGTANTFEATFRVNVTDGEGLIVYDEAAHATSGTGSRGTFDVTASFDVPRAGVGSVIVFEESAKDGSKTNLVEIPVHIS
jgi:sporulation and spore germination protein/immunoglobulin-like protein involved in spore germination